jgi:radical SAM superfamily enzyme YgiQ (UPF0313 family)
MKILLIQPPHYYSDFSRKPSVFPLGLGYLARSLLDYGFDVEVLDIWAHQYTNTEVMKILGRKEFDFVGISALSTQYKYVKWLAREIKKVNKSALICVGGALSTLNSDIVLKYTKVDICVLGEGEKTIVDIMNNFNKLPLVKGIIFLQDGEITKTEPRPLIKNLDSIGFPAWELFPIKIYLENCRLYHPQYPSLKSLNVILGRGCPYNCHFCSKIFKTVRLRSIDNVIDEIKMLKKKFGIEGVFFNDELAVITKTRMLELCRKIKHLGVKWQCQGRVNIVDSELLKTMKQSGCVAIGYGIESGSQTILNNMNKNIKVEDSEKVLKDTIRVGILPLVQMIYGYPGETRETLMESINFLKRIPWKCNFNVLTALPGTKVYADAVKMGHIRNEEEYLEKLEGGYTTKQDYKSFINFTKFSNEEFFDLKDKIENIIRRNFFIESLKNPKFFVNFYGPRIKNIIKEIGFIGLFKRLLFEIGMLHE